VDDVKIHLDVRGKIMDALGMNGWEKKNQSAAGSSDFDPWKFA
jgi:hypothetical protein